jgi:hypothetical protein
MTDSGTGSLHDLSTEELRDRAFAIAEHRRDIAFFWDLAKHLPEAPVVAAEDGSPGEVFGSIGRTIEGVRELFGDDVELGEMEPLFRARFVDYIVKHS